MSAWAWMAEAYARPGVADACVDLQDTHGQCVPYLLWAAWAQPDDQALEAAAEMARRWEAEVLEPLRRVRRALKLPAAGLDSMGREALRAQVIAAEREAERLLVVGLAGAGRDGDPAAALARAARAWGGAPPPVAALAAALG